MGKWTGYYNIVGERPNSLVVGILNELSIVRGSALDLGAGNLRDAKYLKREGFVRVVAVDHSPDSCMYLTRDIDELSVSSLEEYDVAKDSFDLAIALHTLFYLSASDVTVVFQNVFDGLHGGGIFACNVLGVDDDWVVAEAPVSSFTHEAVVALVNGFNIIRLDEITFDQPSSAGLPHKPSKFWHQWNLVLQKP